MMSARDDARHHEVGDRVVGERLEGVDLLGDAHRPDFGGHLCADPACEHESGEQRTQLEDHHLAGDQPDDRQLDAGEELIPRLERDDAADEGGHERREREGIDPNRTHLLDRLREIRLRLAERSQDLAGEVSATADTFEDAQDRRGGGLPRRRKHVGIGAHDRRHRCARHAGRRTRSRPDASQQIRALRS